MYNFEIGLSTAALYPQYLTEEALRVAGEMHFPTVEVFLQSAEEYDTTFGIVLEQQRRKAGIRVHSLHLHAHYFQLWSPYQRMQKEARERFLQLLEIAGCIQAKALTWHGLTHGFNHPHLVDAFLDSLAWAVTQANTAGVQLCIENVSWCYLRTPEQLQKLRDLGLKIGFTFDVFQAYESGVDPTTLIHAMGDQLRTVHLSDYNPHGPRHLPLGSGVVDWQATLQALNDINYQGPLILELAHIKKLDTLRKSRDFIQQALAEASGKKSSAKETSICHQI